MISLVEALQETIDILVDQNEKFRFRNKLLRHIVRNQRRALHVSNTHGDKLMVALCSKAE